MITLKLNGEPVKIKTDLTVGQWSKLKSNEKFYSENSANLLSLYLDMEPDEIKKLPKKNVDFIEKFLRSDLLKMDKPQENLTTFTFQGQEYGLENDWNNLAWGAWADFEILSASDVDKNIHHILAILFRPILKWKGKKYVLKEYDPYDVLERAELFKELPVKYWWWTSNFFFQAAELSIIVTKNSLKWETRIMKLLLRGKKILPKWIQPKVPLDSILR